MAGTKDRSNGWDAVAATFIRDCRETRVGVAQVAAWAKSIAPGGAVLDLGCGPGTRRSDALGSGFSHYAIDASPTLAKAYAERFHNAVIACEAAESSPLFGRKFDGVLSWGLLFLLHQASQRKVIRRVAAALNPDGRFLFTAPWQQAEWADNSTGRRSISLGGPAYQELLAKAGLTVVGEYDDDGQNHYFDSIKRA